MGRSIRGEVVKTGTSDFRKLRTGNGYYVDKSELIDAVFKNGMEVYLFTRPRRFGKSLNLSMLDAYLNIRYAGEPDVFEGLEIERLRPGDPERNSNTVLYVSLKDLKRPTYKSFINMLRKKMGMVYRDFPELRSSSNLDEDERALYAAIASATSDEEDLELSLQSLTRMLEKEHGRKVVVLIDEYDNPVNEAPTPALREEILGFMSGFLSSVLKDNASLKLAVVTGITQIAQASIYSGLNSLYTDSVFDSGFGEYWGFTEEEVRSICADFGDAGRFEEAKEWYDGYLFGGVETYNPWSLLSYVRDGFKTDTHWANTSTNSILETMYRTIGMDDFEQILDLLSGGSFDTRLYKSLTYKEAAEDRRALFSVMAMTGYLKAVPMEGRDGWFTVSFPNKEVRLIMERTVDRLAPLRTAEFERFCVAVVDGDTDRMEDMLGRILLQGSYWNLSDETSYEQILMAVLYGVSGHYRVRSEQEEGNGRVDIVMEPRRPGLAGMVWELKRVDSEKELDAASRKAMEQIHERRYYLGMEGTVLLYGISFAGKVPRMVHERIELPTMHRVS